jgi:hypothetical protein
MLAGPLDPKPFDSSLDAPGERECVVTVPKGRSLPVLYLDFDGVLHHENCCWRPKTGPYLIAPARYSMFQHAVLLQTMLAPYPAIKIVLSTSWVRIYSCYKAAKRLPPGLRSRVIGATYHSQMPGDSFFYMPRGEQVTADVQRRCPSSWLALDDDFSGWPDWALKNFLQTDPYEGISPPELQDRIREKLACLA